MKLQELGFCQWFERHAEDMAMNGGVFARVCAVDRGSYLLRGTAGEVPAELSGRLAFQVDSPSDLPCVGDWVTAQYYNDDTAAIVHGVFPRRTRLRRRAPGDRAGFQMIAANVDTAFIVQSCHYDFNPSRLERYLVMVADGGVAPAVILTKADLLPQEEVEARLDQVRCMTRYMTRDMTGATPHVSVLAVSNVTGAGQDAFRQLLAPGRTHCLLGSSGVGKTTLVNALSGGAAHETRAVSGTGEGTHTTTRRQLLVLDGGALLVDTPGMRELGLMDASEGLDAGFGLFGLHATMCRYADCSHEHEAGCAVRAAVERGELPAERYRNYLKLRKESAFHEMPQHERRRKDKTFGKLVKSAKKHKYG